MFQSKTGFLLNTSSDGQKSFCSQLMISLISLMGTACQFGGEFPYEEPNAGEAIEAGATELAREDAGDEAGVTDLSGVEAGEGAGMIAGEEQAGMETPDLLFRPEEPWEKSPVPAYHFRSTSTELEIKTPSAPDRWQTFILKGMNMSYSLPGTRPGEFTVTEAQIYSWLEDLSELPFNTLRIYTVQSPRFYRALRRWNLDHPHKPFFLLQGVWIREPEEEGEALDYRSDENIHWVQDEIEKVVDVVYGRREIPTPTPEFGGYGRAFGSYHADVSPWLVGWLLGREMEPYTIEETHLRHREVDRYEGSLVSLPMGNPSEALIAFYLDYMLNYQLEHYQEMNAFAFSNWPTLDPLTHFTEPVFPVSSEDHFSVDIERFTLSGGAEDVGQFASYHAYPYYPDFIMYQPDYQVDDGTGVNGYLGYLLKLRSHHMTRPLVITEIGLPSSQGSAHLNPSGLHHGGLTERQVGSGLKRMISNFKEADIAGYCIFEMLDEWFKRAWVVDRLELPASRRHLWYNPMSPEQNFGIIAMAPGPSPEEGGHVINGREGTNEWPDPQIKKERSAGRGEPGELLDITLDHDEGYFHIRLRVEPFESSDPEEGWAKHDYWVVFDTLDPQRGDSCLDPECLLQIEQGVEFKLVIDHPDQALWLVDRPYDLFGIWHNIREPWQIWSTVRNSSGRFVLHRTLTNVPYVYEGEELGIQRFQETGWLPVGDSQRTDTRSNFAAASELGVIEIRIPWTLLAFTDPTTRRVVDDQGSGQRDPDTSISEGIRVWAVHIRESEEGDEMTSIEGVLPIESGGGTSGTGEEAGSEEGMAGAEERGGAEGMSAEEGLQREVVIADTLPPFSPEEGFLLLPEQDFVYQWEEWTTPRWHQRRKLTWSALVDLGVMYPDTIEY